MQAGHVGLALTAVRKAAGGGAPPAPVFLPEDRPATLALSPDLNIGGDSIPFGVGVPLSGTYSFENQLAALMSSGTVNGNAVSGSAWNLPAWSGSPGNPSPIPDVITGAAGYLTNFNFANGSVNGYNNSVVQGGAAESQDFADFIVDGVTAALGPLTEPWAYFLGPMAEAQGPGMTKYSGWQWVLTQLQTAYGPARAYDLMRALQFRGSQDETTLDWKNVDMWGGLPLSFRGMPSDGGDFVAFSNTVLPTAWLTGTTATNTSAGIAALVDPTTVDEGTMFQNLSTSGGIPTSNIWRVGIVAAVKKWELWDPLHLSRWGSAAWALIGFDILAALVGTGAPVASPGRLFCAQDVAAAGACGTIGYFGTAAPATAALFDEDGVAIDTLTLAVGAPTDGIGVITVTRSASGVIAEGKQKFILQTTNGSGRVVHSPVDFLIGQPSTQTVPRLWRLPGTTGQATADFSMGGRTAHGMVDGNKFGFALYVAPEDFASDQQYVIFFGASNGNSTLFQVRISTGGNLNIIANNAAGTLVLNSSTASVFTTGQPTWVAVDIDLDQTTPTIRGYFNKNNAATDTAISASGVASTGPTTLAMSKVEPRFFSVLDASSHNWNYTTSLATRDQFRGRFGNVIVWNGAIGIDGTPSVARELWLLGGTPGAPTPRAPFSAINGVTPIFDIQGGIGDFLRGGFNQNEPVHGTLRGLMGLTL